MSEIQQAFVLLRLAGVYFFFQAILCFLIIVAGLIVALKIHIESVNHLGPYDKDRIKQISKEERKCRK